MDLIGAVHVGTKQYYSDLNQRFRNYDSVLYELVADPEVNKPNQRAQGGFNPISGLQTGMKEALELSFQLDEVDYSPANFVHADMSPGEFGEDMKKRNDGFIGMFARMMGGDSRSSEQERAATASRNDGCYGVKRPDSTPSSNGRAIRIHGRSNGRLGR